MGDAETVVEAQERQEREKLTSTIAVAKATVDALEREAFEDNVLLEMQHDLLASIAAAVHGAPPKGMCWGYHDLPKLIAALKSENAGGEAVPVGYKLLKDTTHDERAWPEDAPLENGNYYSSCGECLRQFTGYKRRVVCKSCAMIAAALQPKEPNNVDA